VRGRLEQWSVRIEDETMLGVVVLLLLLLLELELELELELVVLLLLARGITAAACLGLSGRG